MALAGPTQKNRSRRSCRRLPAVRVVEPVPCIASKWRRQDRTRRCWPDQSHRQRSLPSSATLRVRASTDRMQPCRAMPGRAVSNACKHSGFAVFWFVCGLAGAKQRLDSSLDGAQGLRIELVARIAPHRTIRPVHFLVCRVATQTNKLTQSAANVDCYEYQTPIFWNPSN